jgi:hypothetical protein
MAVIRRPRCTDALPPVRETAGAHAHARYPCRSSGHEGSSKRLAMLDQRRPEAYCTPRDWPRPRL